MLKFKKIRYKNLMASGDAFIEIVLDDSPTTLVVGVNGTGKSTLLEALTFVLYNKPFRKDLNKPDLLNTINGRNCVVEIEFDTNNKSYKIIRGIKPSIFEIYCDDILVNQDAAARDYQEYLEKFILKMNYKAFTQIVILGAASFVPFMQLPTGQRREIIESLLDIQIFSTMNTILKDKVTINRDENVSLQNQEALLNNSLKFLTEHLGSLISDNQKKIESKKLQIANNEVRLTETKSLIKKIDGDNFGLEFEISPKANLIKQQNELIQLQIKIDHIKRDALKDIEFYQNNNNCPTCQQDIDEHFKTNKIPFLKQKHNEADSGLSKIAKRLANVNLQLAEINEKIGAINENNLKITRQKAILEGLERNNQQLETEITELALPGESAIETEAKLNETETKLTELEDKRRILIENKHYLDMATVLLKDGGIKTMIIKKYLPIMNKYVNKYLGSMDFFINFNIDENFDEVIKSRYRDTFKYASFSEGEKMRIDLALMLTWRAVAKIKNSVNTNLLILDEVFDRSLDGAGTDDFIKLMDTFGENTNTIVISHKGLLIDKFKKVIRFEKVKNFSQIVEVEK